MTTPYTIDELKQRLIPVLKENGTKKATLYGSYAKGTATKESDVDILVDSGLTGLRFFGLLDDVVNALECEVDLIDIVDIIPDSPVEHEINRTGVVLYER